MRRLHPRELLKKLDQNFYAKQKRRLNAYVFATGRSAEAFNKEIPALLIGKAGRILFVAPFAGCKAAVYGFVQGNVERIDHIGTA